MIGHGWKEKNNHLVSLPDQIRTKNKADLGFFFSNWVA